MISPAADDPMTSRWLKLSALCDGEATPGEAQDCAERWREEPALRGRWHDYQLIGDVLRSDDLAHGAARDEAFLQAFRARLAAEPVVLAPTPRVQDETEAPLAMPVTAGGAAAAARRPRWGAPAAVAAGVMAVAGVLVVIQGSPTLAPGDSPSRLLAGPAQPPVVVNVAGAPALAPAGAGSDALGGAMLRNPELDRYLAAHRQFAQGPALTTPSGVRHVAATPDGR